jgi:hypothetical protein
MPLSVAMALHGVAITGVVDTAAAAAEYCYFDEDDASLTHGPFPLTDIVSWAEDGFFEPSNIIFPPSDRSAGISVGEAAAAAGLDVAPSGAAVGADESSERAEVGGDGPRGAAGEQRAWHYPDEDDKEMMHGPFTLNELHEWYASGALGAGEVVYEGEARGTAAVLLVDALVAAGIITSGIDDAWYYVEGDRTQGPFPLAELQEWKHEAYFDGDLPVFRAGEAARALDSAIEAHAVVGDVAALAVI